MNEAIIGLSVAAIGLVAALLGAIVAGGLQALIEIQKEQAARQDELDREIRIAVAELCRKIVAIVHAAHWFAWYAKNQPSRFDDSSDLEEYVKKSSQLWAEMMSSLAIISALDKDKYAVMNEIVDKVIILDEEMSKALVDWARSGDKGINAMASSLPDFDAFYGELNKSVADMFNTKKEKEVVR